MSDTDEGLLTPPVDADERLLTPVDADGRLPTPTDPASYRAVRFGAIFAS